MKKKATAGRGNAPKRNMDAAIEKPESSKANEEGKKKTSDVSVAHLL